MTFIIVILFQYWHKVIPKRAKLFVFVRDNFVIARILNMKDMLGIWLIQWPPNYASLIKS